MEKKTLVLKPTFKGILPGIFSTLFWIILSVIALQLLNYPINEELKVLKEESVWKAMSRLSAPDWLMPYWLGTIVAKLIMFIAILSLIELFIYGLNKKMTLLLSEENEIESISDEYYTFPFNHYCSEAVCSRILKISVEKEFLGTFINVGMIRITFVMFANADFKKETWHITGIEDPENWQKRIQERSPKHQGVLVKAN